MPKLLWIAMTTAALAVATRSSRADEPATLPETAPPAVAPELPGIPDIAAPATEAATVANAQRCPTCGNAMCGCECATCGKRQRKVARFLDWLIYVPLDHGKTKCCPICESCPPPVWAFFPCEKGRCASCAAGPTLFYAKEAGAAHSNRVVQTAYPPANAAKPAAPAPDRISSYQPQSVSQKMPTLDPTQFHKAGTGN